MDAVAAINNGGSKSRGVCVLYAFLVLVPYSSSVYVHFVCTSLFPIGIRGGDACRRRWKAYEWLEWNATMYTRDASKLLRDKVEAYLER